MASENERRKSVRFGQVVIGPPGSGKTTYCAGMKEMLLALGRDVAVVNLDPGNESILLYEPAIDVRELVDMLKIQETLNLGPNASLLYCLEFLELNMEWLINKLDQLKENYILFDFPGQVELFAVHNSVRNITQILQKHDWRLSAVNIIDSHLIGDPSKYVSMVILALMTMLHLELPHVNILSKIDLLKKQRGTLLTDMDLDYAIEQMTTNPSMNRFGNFNRSLCDLIDDFPFIGFRTLDIQDKESVMHIVKVIDQTIGYYYLAQDAVSISGTSEK